MHGRLFRIVRKLNGHTQSTAAQRIGITQSAVCKFENGEIRHLHRRHMSALRSYAVSAARMILEPLGVQIDES